mgnify:CR=1 FL=1
MKSGERDSDDLPNTLGANTKKESQRKCGIPFRKELCDEEWLLEDGKLTITKNKDAKSVFQKGAKAADGDAA